MDSKEKKKKDPYSPLRSEMVRFQIEGRGIKDRRVLTAMAKVERHLFVPEEFINEAYNDYPIPIGRGQTISQPYIVAAMTEALELQETDKVLEIGTGSGYQTAILREIAREVYTIERDSTLAESAKSRLHLLEYTNIFFKVGDGTLGWEEASPFQAIVVTAAALDIPPTYLEQIDIGGRIVIPVGSRYSQTLLRIVRIDENTYKRESLFDCAFVPLVGKYGFPDDMG